MYIMCSVEKKIYASISSQELGNTSNCTTGHVAKITGNGGVTYTAVSINKLHSG